MKRTITLLGGLLALPILLAAQPQPTRLLTSSELLLELQKTQTVGTVLYIAAHPDDENTAMIAYLAQIAHLRTGYLSLTRGGGGQNLIGSHLGDDLGVIRTQELLAARAMDGGQQFFSRARDFGFSKTPSETYRIWQRDSVLADVVWVIRTFRPDVIITRFSPNEKLYDTHGHHTASAQLAVEAAVAAGDSTRFPEQLTYPEAKPWSPQHVYWNSFNGFGLQLPDSIKLTELQIGLHNQLLGKGTGELAAESRSMHKSQGFGVLRTRGERTELLTHLWGLTPEPKVPLQGVATSCARLDGGEALAKHLSDAVLAFNPTNPSIMLPHLAAAYRATDKLADPFWQRIKRQQVANLIRQAIGLWVEAASLKPTYSPTDNISVAFEHVLLQSQQPIRLNEWQVLDRSGTPLHNTTSRHRNIQLHQNLLVRDTITFATLSDLPLSTPFWLQNPHNDARYTLPGQAWVGRAAPEPLLRVAYSYTLTDLGLTLQDTLPVVYKYRSPTDGDIYQPVEILPPICINPEVPALVFGNDQPQELTLKLTAIADAAEGTLSLELPEGWRYDWVSPPTLPVRGQESVARARIYPGSTSGQAMAVFTTSGGERFSLSLTRIRYDHIPLQTILRPASIRLVRTQVSCTAHRIGYVPGAGDEVAQSLQAAGIHVETLDDATLTAGELSGYDAILVGIRAYNTQPRIHIWHPRLVAYAENGGTLVLQYNTTSNFLAGNPHAWMEGLGLSRLRVTDETAVVTIAPHPILQTPNAIHASDFEGWVQERGLYFLDTWPESWDAPLSMADPDEQPLRGSLVIGHVGRGTVIYTGLSFFRQLPAGVPGAYRLLANLLSYKPAAK